MILIGAAGVVFGIATLKEGGAVLFIDGAGRAAAGHYVPFVVWFNFIAAFAYLAAGVGIARGVRSAAGLAVGIGAATALVAAIFAGYVFMGGAYEQRTVGALAIRTLFWLLAGWRASARLK